jgi:hypothetical protein
VRRAASASGALEVFEELLEGARWEVGGIRLSARRSDLPSEIPSAGARKRIDSSNEKEYTACR